MKLNCLCISFLLVLHISCSSGQTCSINETVKNASCICDDLNSSVNGWLYTCMDSLSLNSLFSVQYVPDESLTFQCEAQEPNYSSILGQIDLGEIHKFVFKSCPFPSIPYNQIIPFNQKHPIEELKIEYAKGDGKFTAELFGNLSESIENLILRNNKIEAFSDSLLNNFTKLKYLSLNENKLRTLTNGMLSQVSNLKTLEITNNAVEILEENVFQNLRLLEKLYLYKNKLKILPKNVFNNLINLQILDLAENNLMLLPDGVFDNLSNLRQIRLRANWIMTLSENLFNSSTQLKDIDLSLNKFMEPLPKYLLSGLNQLDNIQLPNCNLTEIPEDFFVHCPNLTNINLEQNSITSLPKSIFINNSILREINLNFNQLNELPRDLFPSQMKLEKLSFFKNNISSIPDGLFQRARKITNLVLGSNKIRNASQSVFRDLPNLEILDLSWNSLIYFKLDLNENIKQIDLSHNAFTEVPTIQWTQHLKLTKLNLEYNNITFLYIPVLYSTNKQSPILNFAFNNIKTVNIENVLLNDQILKDLPVKDYDNYVQTRILLKSNPFNCDCQLYKFYDYIKRNEGLPKSSVRFDMIQNLSCQEPLYFSGKKITSLQPSMFTCKLNNQCSYPCQCYVRAADSANIVNCSYSGLESLPVSVPNNTNVLLFEDNKLANMSEFDSEIWENLTELYLDKNEIVTLEQWKIPFHLRNISLHGNRISYFPSFFMNYISNSENFQITLSENPWSCNCSAISFKKWLVEHYYSVKDVQEVLCANRLKLNGTYIRSSILTTPDEVFCPLDDSPYKMHLISVIVICVILALLLFIVSVLYYRNKQTVVAYVYIHMHNVFTCFFSEDDMDEDKIFDAFVSYSSSDRDVALMLIEELENKEPVFQLCIHERNWIAGNQISWNIFNSVHNSKRTILVISKEFLESMWFQVEFHTAYYQMLEDKIDRLIIIVKGDLPPKENMDKELQYLLSTKTYLIWEEKWFWEKLKYALPHKKTQMLSNEVIALRDRPAIEKIKPVDNQIAILSAGGPQKEKFTEAHINHTDVTLHLQQICENGINNPGLITKEYP